MKTEQRNKLNFKGQNIYVGIDVHLKSWSVTVLLEDLLLKTFSQSPEPEALHKFLVTHYPGANYYSVYEAGFCGFWIHERLRELGITNIVVNPADVATKSKEKLRKTDAGDSNKLARELRSGDLDAIYVPNVQTLELRSLIRLRNSIVKDLTRGKNRIKSFLHFHGIRFPEEFDSPGRHWSRRFVQWLREIEFSTEHGRKALDLHIEQFSNLRDLLLQETKIIRKLSRNEPFASSMRLITSVPGIGIITGISLLSEIDDIGRFPNADHLAAFIGLTPMCHGSGDDQRDGDITIRKHGSLRCSIIEAAWIAIRHDPAMTMAYQEYRKRMHVNKAIVKIARKLVNRIYYVLKRKQQYVPCVVK
jgi:transposase